MGQGVIKPFKFQIPMHGSSFKVLCKWYLSLPSSSTPKKFFNYTNPTQQCHGGKLIRNSIL